MTKETLNFHQPWYRQLQPLDWAWALLAAIATGFAWQQYHHYMDGYEVAILFATGASLVALGWHWKAIRGFSLGLGVLSLLALQLYGSDYSLRESNFFLKYLLSSESAIAWMSALYFMATGAFLIGLLADSDFGNQTGSRLTWAATLMGLTGLMVRWRETYLIDFDFGHIPVSNLYEVFVLFCVLTALLYLYYERKFNTRQLGFFASLVISMAVGFVLWYSMAKGAAEIQPLVPALKSYWMKIHVPANFIGYGAFSLAAMLGLFYLALDGARSSSPSKKAFWIYYAAALLVAGIWSIYTFVKNSITAAWPFIIGFIIAALIIERVYFWRRQTIAKAKIELNTIEDISYKAIALGFAFFTIATILGALWAAEAWGSYWSWDPKETWALIVWLNYAAWLHMRLVQGWSGRVMAWWALIGFFITLFCFLGVNMFLSGLHSYGEL